MDYDNQLGKVVYSKAGRDAGKFFIIVSILDEKYVFVSDGDLRTVDKPKKKKIKHLGFTDAFAADIRASLLSKEKITNSRIRKCLQSYDASKEV